MSSFVYIDLLITIGTLVLSAGLLSWLIRFIKKSDRVAFRKGLAWVLPLVAISFIDVFICIGIIMLLPGTPSTIEASDGLYLGRVVVQWKPSAGAKTYTVLRSTESDGQYRDISGNISKTSFIDTSVPPGKYYYRVVASNDVGKSLQSKADPGNPAVSDVEFFRLYAMTEKSALGKLTKLGKLGREVVRGAFGGSITYEATFDHRALVTNTYADYCDYDKSRGNSITLNGSLVTETDMFGNGTTMGRVDVSGTYSGSVTYNLTIRDKKKAGGYYTVGQAGRKSTTSVPWNFQ
jgi:hypothetical protein